MADLPTRVALEVVTPLGLALRTEVLETEIPSVLGEFGVLPGHLPFLANVKAGVVKYRGDGGMHVAAVGPGFVEAGPTKVAVLTDKFVRAEEIDVAQANEDLTDAEVKLVGFGERHEGAKYEEIQRAIDWARARLDAVEAARQT